MATAHASRTIVAGGFATVSGGRGHYGGDEWHNDLKIGLDPGLDDSEIGPDAALDGNISWTNDEIVDRCRMFEDKWEKLEV